MAWCPKCKNEYREGITVCAECGCELVSENVSLKQVPIISGTEELMCELKRFMEYNQLEDISVSWQEQEEAFVLSVKDGDREMAAKIARVFMEQKAEPENEAASQKGQSERNSPASAGVYQSNAQKAEENRSSAWTFLLVGGAGLAAVALGILGVLPFRIGNPYLVYGVMSAVFLLFIVMGFTSMKSARLFAKHAESENSLKGTLLEWCRANLRAEDIDSRIQDEEELPREALYLKRYEVIRSVINHQFMNLDQELVEHLIDEEVYDMVFETEEQP